MTREKDKDRELWLRAAPARAETQQPGEPVDAPMDALDLAAYLDGTLDAQAVDALEARLAAEPDLLDAVLSARLALAETPEAAPPRVVARAQASVAGPGRVAAPRGGWFSTWLRPLGWATVAVLALVVSGAGFEIGREGYDAVVEVQSLMTETVAFDFSDPASDLFL